MKTNADYWQDYVLNDIPESYRLLFQEEQKYLVKHIKKGSKVLEVACGDGRSIKEILSITNNITGIDHDDNAVSGAKKKFPNVKIINADASNMPFPDQEFDYVTCMISFMNFADKKYEILKEKKRVLKEGGSIILSIFSEDAFEERMKVYKGCGVKIKEIKGTTVVFDEDLGDNISEQFSKEQLVEIFDTVDLRIVDIKKTGIAYLCKLEK